MSLLIFGVVLLFVSFWFGVLLLFGCFVLGGFSWLNFLSFVLLWGG